MQEDIFLKESIKKSIHGLPGEISKIVIIESNFGQKVKEL